MTDRAEGFILRQIQPDDDTTKFSLGDANFTPLKIFLQKNALDFHRYEIAKTYVLVKQSEASARVWGYITLMNSEIDLCNDEQRPHETSATARYPTYPTVKIARLAVDKSEQRKGWGQVMLDWCINHVKLAIMPHVGCRFLVVDAKRGSMSFYQESGFVFLNTEANHSAEHPLMFFDLLTAKSS